jgi:hypothetical protein
MSETEKYTIVRLRGEIGQLRAENERLRTTTPAGEDEALKVARLHLEISRLQRQLAGCRHQSQTPAPTAEALRVAKALEWRSRERYGDELLDAAARLLRGAR